MSVIRASDRLLPSAGQRQDGFMRALKKVVGFVLLLGGLLFTTMALYDLVTGADPETGNGVLLGLVVFFGAVTLGGAQLLRAKGKGGDDDDVPLEVIALRTAAAHGGTLGAAQLAASAGVPLADAREVLQSCVRQGACTVIVDEGGLELYRFGELSLSPAETAKARDLLSE